MANLKKTSIVLALFGTTEPAAALSIQAVKQRVEEAFPGHAATLACTSPAIRETWHQRNTDVAFKKDNPGVPEEFYSFPDIRSALETASGAGSERILVQPLYITDGSGYLDLKKSICGFIHTRQANSPQRPTPIIKLGIPALGVEEEREKYLYRAAKALEELAETARREESVLVLVAHGNAHRRPAVLDRFEHILQELYGTHICIGTIKAPRTAEQALVTTLTGYREKHRKALLAPLMLTAGRHMLDDMAGGHKDSWSGKLHSLGFSVDCHMKGLAENTSWVNIYIEYLQTLASDGSLSIDAHNHQTFRD